MKDFSAKIVRRPVIRKEWRATFDIWAKDHPDLLKVYEEMAHNSLPEDIESRIKAIEIKSPVSGRKASQEVLNALAAFYHNWLEGLQIYQVLI